MTSGMSGYTLVVTGTGETVAAARDAANALADKVVVPNARYRRDIGQRLIGGEFEQIEVLGLLSSGQSPSGRQSPSKPRRRS